MKTFVIKGNLCFSRSMDELVCMEHSYIVVEDGRATGIFRTLPERYAQLPVLDYEDRLVLPGMTDLHIHAPQFAFRGLGMDMELLEWLNTYPFPEESKYKELEYADRAYSSFVEHLLHSTTTRAAIFATIHVPATKLLMQKLDEAGLSCYVGKVNMNRNSPVYLREISTNQALRDTESWLCETKEAARNVKPILTPQPMHLLGSTQLAPQPRQRAVSVCTCSDVSVLRASRNECASTAGSTASVCRVAWS